VYLANEAGIDQRFRDLHLAPAALVEADLQDHSRLGAGFDHLGTALDIERQRLLAKHVLAARRRGDHGGGVVSVRRRHDDGIDVLRLEQLGKLGRRAPDAEIASQILGPATVEVEDAADRCVGRA